MLVKGGRSITPFGVMGGYYQAVGRARRLSKMLDYGLDVQEAIDLPRVMSVSGSTAVVTEQARSSDCSRV